MYKFFLRPILFRIDPENIHYRIFGWLKVVLNVPFFKSLVKLNYQFKSPNLETKLFGLTFPNRVGLAAGFDKDASLYKELDCFGFGFIEVGTVTPKAQDGNPKPRMFRLPQDKALINRMGFNNGGVNLMVDRLKNRDKNQIIGGNIGKNKATPNEDAIDDYLFCFKELFNYVDYFVVNVSSPNTPNLRELQEKEPLKNLLNAIQDENAKKEKRKPILLKIAPDLTYSQLDDIIDIIFETNLDGVIATNTTIDRSNLATEALNVDVIGPGGLSGKPLTNRATEVIRYLSEKSKGKIPIVAVGGIFTAKDAIEKLEAGAHLLQVYTGFIYEGPSIVKNINKALHHYYNSK